jgi:isopenicillin-N epimerase
MAFPLNRRNLLRSTAAAAAAALYGVGPSWSSETEKSLPSNELFTSNPEKYWLQLREEQFYLPDWRVFLNNGSLGVAPRPVLKAVTDYLDRSAALNVDEYPRWGYETLDDYRAEMAAFVGCKKEELAFTHNATEAMSTIAAGLDLKSGDEVLLTDQEHPSGRSGWLVRQARHGITVREVKIPLPPKSSAELADLIISSFGPKTRVVCFSGITSPTGLILPMKEICAAARAKGIISVIDGAHINGQIPVRLSELGCDYYVGSPHKWLFAPAGSGLLYIREENLTKLWPTVVSARWDDQQLGAARFMMMGTNNRSIFEGTMAGLRFAKQIGPERIYERIHALSRYTYAKANECPHVTLLTPEDHTLYGSLVSIRFKKGNPTQLWKVCKEKKIWVVEGERVRLSAHIHTRKSDIDEFFAVLNETLG